ncbi:MAG: DNA/RNA nuclease SfsA [Sumerlaeia bacterium]
MTFELLSIDKSGFPIRIRRGGLGLTPGVLVQRYKRFLADIQLDSGELITAHCVNTGRMEGLTRPGLRVWVSPATNPNRKLKYTWELTEVAGEIIGTNTGFPNGFVKFLLENNLLSFLPEYHDFKAEVTVAKSHRVDFQLELEGGKRLLIEVKNCHLIYPDGIAYFPDSISERATKHLQGLVEQIDDSTQCCVLHLCQIPDVKAVRPSDAHDPVYAATARKNKLKGLNFFGLCLKQTPEEILVQGLVPVDLEPYSLANVEKWKLANEAASKKPII